MKETKQKQYRNPEGEPLTRESKLLLLKILKEGRFTEADKEALRCGLHSPMVIFDSLRDCRQRYEDLFKEPEGESPYKLTETMREIIMQALKAGKVDESLYLELCAAFGVEIFCVVFTD
jgi:hypothetical protein